MSDYNVPGREESRREYLAAMELAAREMDRLRAERDTARAELGLAHQHIEQLIAEKARQRGTGDAVVEAADDLLDPESPRQWQEQREDLRSKCDAWRSAAGSPAAEGGEQT